MTVLCSKKMTLKYMIQSGQIDAADFITRLQDTVDGLSKNNKAYMDAYSDILKSNITLEQQLEKAEALLIFIQDHGTFITAKEADSIWLKIKNYFKEKDK